MLRRSAIKQLAPIDFMRLLSALRFGDLAPVRNVDDLRSRGWGLR